MINLDFNIHSPWGGEYFRNLGCWHTRLGKNKSLELEHSFYSQELVTGSFKLNRGCDHAGLELTLGLLGYCIRIQFYDTRHWNHESHDWMEGYK